MSLKDISDFFIKEIHITLMLIEEKLIDQEIIDTCVLPLGDSKSIVIDAFLEQAGEFVSAIIKASEAQDFSSVTRIVHSLKGTSLQLGFHRLGMIAKEIEDIARGDKQGDCIYTQLGVQLKLSYDATLSYIHGELLSK